MMQRLFLVNLPDGSVARTITLDGSTPEGDFTEVTEFQPDTLPVPQSVSKAQAKLALLDAGLLDQVETAVANHPMREVQIWYSDANVWERSNQYVWALASELGLTDEQVINLFIAAAQK